MPTNDERREVAAALRDLAAVTAHIHLTDSNFVSLLCGIIFDGAEWDINDRNPEGLIINRLADLIELEERTCRNVDGMEWDFKCSECGCELDVAGREGDVTMWLNGSPMEPSFCPNCGAKVVSE